MKIYFADAISINRDYSHYKVHCLESYYKFKEAEKLLMNGISLFLDSGAFSAWAKNTTINIDEYIKFIKKYEEYLDVYAVLDDITSPERTWGNQKYMETAGLKPLPVFHYGEPVKWLKKCMEYEYFAIGGMVPISNQKLKPWLDNIWSLLVNNKGEAKYRVHGFGLTSVELITRYPWFSVDSTSWIMTGRYGGVFCDTGSFNKIKLSVQGNLQDAAHWFQLKKHDQENIRKYFAERGFTIEELQTDYKKRDEANIKYFLELEKKLTKNPPKFKNHIQRKLFEL